MSVLQNILKQNPKSEDYLIETLLSLQDAKDEPCISEEEIADIAEYYGISPTRVSSVASFYTLLSLRPRGKHVVQVCRDVPCYLNGSENILEAVKEALGCDIGETTADGLFTLEETSCLGNCDGSPSVRIGKKTYENLDSQKVKEIISGYREAK